MKEYVFSFKDKLGQHIGRFEGKDEAEAFENLKKMFPDAEKLAGFVVDATLAKILDAVKHVDDKDELNDIAANDEKHQKLDAIERFKANAEQFKRQKQADTIAKNTLTRGEMEQHEWNTITSSMTPEEKKELYDEFIADADKNHSDKKMAEIEKKFINYIFGVKEKGKWTSDNMTLRDLAKMLDVSHVRVLSIQKAALTKLVNNIAKMKHYPFKITTAEEAIALLLADNVANPEDLKLKVKVNGDMNFEDALKKMVKMERERARKSKEWTKADNKRRSELMKEFKQLEKETNDIRDGLGLPRQYEKFFKFFTGQKLGNWA